MQLTQCGPAVFPVTALVFIENKYHFLKIIFALFNERQSVLKRNSGSGLEETEYVKLSTTKHATGQ